MKRVLIPLAVSVATTGCDGVTGNSTASRMLGLAEANLRQGDSYAHVEAFFRRVGWEHGCIDVLAFCDATGPDSSTEWRHVVVRVYLDSDRRFVRAEPRISYNAP